MNDNERNECRKKDHYPFTGLGRWYSWDTPVGLGLGLFLALVSISFLIYMIRHSGYIM